MQARAGSKAVSDRNPGKRALTGPNVQSETTPSQTGQGTRAKEHTGAQQSRSQRKAEELKQLNTEKPGARERPQRAAPGVEQ